MKLFFFRLLAFVILLEMAVWSYGLYCIFFNESIIQAPDIAINDDWRSIALLITLITASLFIFLYLTVTIRRMKRMRRYNMADCYICGVPVIIGDPNITIHKEGPMCHSCTKFYYRLGSDL